MFLLILSNCLLITGSKAARQKPKGNKKMRDQKLNLKGVDKEGSDMDAFVDTSEEKERPSSPPGSPPPTSPPAIVPAPEDKIKVTSLETRIVCVRDGV